MNVVIKRVEEVLNVLYDFSQQVEILAGDTIAAITTAPTAVNIVGGGVIPVFTSPTITADKKGVSVVVSGGVKGSRYSTWCVVTLTSGVVRKCLGEYIVGDV